MNELVTIIVPIYNVENEITRCVNSLVNQTYENIEILLIDDGSIDNSGAIADKFAIDYPSLVKVVHQKNRGLSGARNAGLDMTTGKFIAFVDSDDYVEDNMIEIMVNSLLNNKCDISVCGRYNEYPNWKNEEFVHENERIYTPEETINRIMTWDGIDVAACDKLFDAHLWKGIRFPEGYNNEDICTMPEIIFRSSKIVHVGKPLYHYCHRNNSITTIYNEKKIKDFSRAIGVFHKKTCKYFPNSKSEMIYYMNHSYLWVWAMCEEIDYKGNEKVIAKEYLFNNWKNVFSKKHMSLRLKIMYLLLRGRIYGPIKNIYRKIKYNC